MAILTMKSTIKGTKYNKKKVADIVNEQGAIFYLIKNGYDFDDEVLEAARVQKNITNEKAYCRVGVVKDKTETKKLPVDTASLKQILSEINTLENIDAYDTSAENNNDNTWNEDETEDEWS